MLTNTDDLPIYEYGYQNNGHYTREVRGVWGLAKDFIGGPFATFVMLNEDTNEIVFIDTFVYAPGKDKRDHMQQLEYIAKTAKLVDGSSS